MPKSRKTTRKPARSWRKIPDEILLSRNVKGSVFDMAEPVRPTEGTMIRYCSPGAHGHEKAVEIIHSYRLLASTITLAVIA